jgi:hypothetical protein
MESLKRFAEILVPDPRQLDFVLVDNSTGTMRPTELKDLYGEAEKLVLHQNVPEAVRYHFENARNLLVYSWFHYPFNSLAMFHGFIAVEKALKIRAGKPRAMLGTLLPLAVKQGWIKDEEFTFGRAQIARRKTPPDNSQTSVAQDTRTYCEILMDSMPNLRNTFAHGEVFLHNGWATSMLICAELINQLFPQPSDQRQ